MDKLLGLIDIWGGIAIIVLAIIGRYNARKAEWEEARNNARKYEWEKERRRDEFTEMTKNISEYMPIDYLREMYGMPSILVNAKTGHVEIMENPTKSIDPPEIKTKRERG